MPETTRGPLPSLLAAPRAVPRPEQRPEQTRHAEIGPEGGAPLATSGRADRRLEAPAKEVIAGLPPFAGLPLARIRLMTGAVEIDAAIRILQVTSHVGFDTESKPTFVRGEVSDGPHLVQFATLDEAYLFPLHVPGAVDAVAQLLQSDQVTKVGFGLDSDRAMLSARHGIVPKAILDLDLVFRRIGYRRSLGLKSAVAVVFGQQFTKSKKIGTSNWAMHRLSDRQLLYAANDAYAAIRVFAALPDDRR